MLEQVFNWFLTTKAQILRKGGKCGFKVLMLMSIAHLFGLYNPKELADYLDIRSQCLYVHLKSLSLYSLQKLMLGFMVKQAAQQLNEVLHKSAATKSRAAISNQVDDSVLERVGKEIRAFLLLVQRSLQAGCYWQRSTGTSTDRQRPDSAIASDGKPLNKGEQIPPSLNYCSRCSQN